MGLSQRLSLAAYWASMTAWALVMVGFGLFSFVIGITIMAKMVRFEI